MNTPAQHAVDVLITTYQRPEYLVRCLESLRAQTLAPARVVVVTRDTDADSRKIADEYAASHPGLKLITATVSVPGVIAANNAAYPLLQSDIVAMLDDDSTAPPDWLQTLTRHYADPLVGAAGGRIRNHRDGRLLYEKRVVAGQRNRMDIFGRLHPVQMYPFEGVWDVDFLVGCNMSFRRKILPPCDPEIIGDGYYYELDLCLIVQALGYRIILDSAAVNDHWSAPRTGPQRNDPACVRCNRYNESYVLAKHNRGLIWTALRALFYWLPRDTAGWLMGRAFWPLRFLASSFQGLYRGCVRGRSMRRLQLQQLKK